MTKQGNNGEATVTAAKVMNRSRNQLATSYAPESFFTFEGGSGACLSQSTAGEPIPDLAEATLDQVFARINELGRAWFSAAMSARDNDATKARVLPSQCVDGRLLDNARNDFQAPGQDRVYLCRPSHMEYTPAPLTFVCRTCGLFRDYESLRKLDEALPELTETTCPNPKVKGRCDWEQLDVLFVHWSGEWQAAFPGQFQWSDAEQKVVKRRSSCTCSSYDFRLNRKQAGIGDWFFECAKCGKPLSPKWRQNDPETLRLIGPSFTEARRTEVSMQAAPYRASSVYYVKQDLFIDFKDGGRDILARLRPGREEALKDFIASRYGLGTSPSTDADVVAACTGRPDCSQDLLDYQAAVDKIAVAEAQVGSLPPAIRATVLGLLDETYKRKEAIVQDLRRREILIPKTNFPESLETRLRHRQSLFASKFDPFRLAVEHATLEATRLAVETREGGKKPYVSFTRLDEDFAPDTAAERDAMQSAAEESLARLGLADMGLIRAFDLCRFTFGFSRMEAGPVLHDKRGMDMPVKLRLFPPVKHNGTQKNPIYVVQQGNEAIYVRLAPDVVILWLNSLGCADMFALSGSETIGAGILSSAHAMSPFLDKLSQGDNPLVYSYLYTLLHSYAHLLMKRVSEYSGLDAGSLGEYIFPADLAFVVYRNGTTMDLGNLSAMWRNAGIAMLSALLSSKATQCGTGSLCAHRGGSCPDCIMVPETSCVAGNKLLSRSVLRATGGRPRFDTRAGPIRGYLDFAAAKWPAR